MPYLNEVILLGNLAGDPELVEVDPESKVATFTVAINSGQEKKRADFFDCEAWGGWGENLVKNAKKGSLVLVHGKLIQHRWTDSETSKKRSRIKVRAQQVFTLQIQYSGREPGEDDVAGEGGDGA